MPRYVFVAVIIGCEKDVWLTIMLTKYLLRYPNPITFLKCFRLWGKEVFVPFYQKILNVKKLFDQTVVLASKAIL